MAAAIFTVTPEPVATICDPTLEKPTSPLSVTNSLTDADMPFSAKATVPAAIAPLYW